VKNQNLRHIYKYILDFLSRFLRIWLQSFNEVLILPKKIFCQEKSKEVSKTPNFMLISNPLKKFVKNAPK
jgi:hypothetical protein